MLKNHKENKSKEKLENTELLKDKKISKEEMKEGWDYLLSQGNAFKLFLAMIGYFILLYILEIFGVIRGIWVLILSLPVVIAIGIAYLVYINKHGNDEMR